VEEDENENEEQKDRGFFFTSKYDCFYKQRSEWKLGEEGGVSGWSPGVGGRGGSSQRSDLKERKLSK
jgi:hypothetical protein